MVPQVPDTKIFSLSLQRALTGADIEIVSSPMEAINKQKSDRSYSTHQAYEKVDDVNQTDQQRESWPEPPSQTKAVRAEERSSPPDRVPPRVLPKPPMQKTISENMFV